MSGKVFLNTANKARTDVPPVPTFCPCQYQVEKTLKGRIFWISRRRTLIIVDIFRCREYCQSNIHPSIGNRNFYL